MIIAGKGNFLQWEKLVSLLFGKVVHSLLRNAAGEKNVIRLKSSEAVRPTGPAPIMVTSTAFFGLFGVIFLYRHAALVQVLKDVVQLSLAAIIYSEHFFSAVDKHQS